MRKLYVLIAVLLAAGMIFTACQPAPAPTAAPTEPPAAEPTEPEATEPEPTEAPVEEPAMEFKSKDPSTLNIAYADLSVDTLDPALAYDTMSGEILQNIYETLVFYNGESLSEYVPQLASEMPTVSADGLVYTFKIREGVKFHNGNDLSPTDVAYSLQRGLLQGGGASPQLLLAEPFFGFTDDLRGIWDVTMLVDPADVLSDDRAGLIASDPALVKAACETVQAKIVADDAAGTVTMTLAVPWGPFVATLANNWGAIMDKEWVVENGGWDGTCDTWQNFYGMSSADNPLSTIANGTGPFKLDKFVNQDEIVLVRNDDYWREPAKLEKIVWKQVPEWGTRFAMMQTGDADLVTVPPANRSQMDALVGQLGVYDAATGTYSELVDICGYDGSKLAAEKFVPCEAGVTSENPFVVRIGRPNISMDVMLPNWNIATSEESPNPYIGSGQLDGNGIPADFFSDIHVRKALAYCFDWETFIDDVFAGEAVKSFQLPLEGQVGFDPDMPQYEFDLAKCEEEFKLADIDKDGIAAGDETDGTDVWNVGFRVQMAYNQGNPTRQTIAEILSANLSAVNPLFSVETLGLPWATYLRIQRAKQLPLLTGGWLEDIHDPYNWFQPYTYGTYGGRQGLPNELKQEFQADLVKAVTEPDDAARAELYKAISMKYYELAVGIPLETTTTHGFAQRWVKGQVLNPIFSGGYYYTWYKD